MIYMIPFMQHSWNDAIVEMENRLVVFRGQRWGWNDIGRWVWLLKCDKRDPWYDGNVLYLDCVNVNILVVTPFCSLANHYHWGKLGKWYMRFLYTIYYNLLWVYNYLKIKSLKKLNKRGEWILGQSRDKKSFYISQSLLEFMSIESVMLFNYLILYHSLLLPSVFPSIMVFFNELALHIWWSKYGSVIFSINPSNEYTGISFKTDWFDLLAVTVTIPFLFKQRRFLIVFGIPRIFLLMLLQVYSQINPANWTISRILNFTCRKCHHSF